MRKELLLILILAGLTPSTFASDKSSAATKPIAQNLPASETKPIPTQIPEKRETISNSELENQKSRMESNIQIELLKVQNQLIKENQSAIIGTVYLALGGIFTLAAVLSGVGWWSNFKLYESDKKRLLEELSGKITTVESALNLKLETNKSDIEREIHLRISSQLEKISSDNTEIRLNINNIENNIHRIDELNQKEISDINKTIHSNHIAHQKLTSDVSQIEAHIWDIKKVRTNQILTQLEALRYAYQAGSEWEINNLPGKITDNIQKHFIDGDEDARERTINLLKGLASDIAKFDDKVAANLISYIEQIKIRASD